MAMAVQPALRNVDRVISSALDSYAGHHDRAIEVPLTEVCDRRLPAEISEVLCVVAGAQRLVEMVVDYEPDCEVLVPAVWALAGRGWDTVALVPLERLGEAHQALRGAPCRLQPWWLEGDDIQFGCWEIP